jgi:hypothetical protein
MSSHQSSICAAYNDQLWKQTFKLQMYNWVGQHNIYVQHAITHGGTGGGGTALQARRSRAWFPMVSFSFLIDLILLAILWLWGQLTV